MTTRIFRAAGTLAAALVFLAGCDSAGPTAPASAALTAAGPSATANRATVNGPGELNYLCTGTYSISTTGAGTWAITYGTASITTQYAAGHFRYVKVLGDGAPFSLAFTLNGQSSPLGEKDVTANPLIACG